MNLSNYMKAVLKVSRDIAIDLGYSHIATIHFILADLENENSFLLPLLKSKHISSTDLKDKFRLGPRLEHVDALPLTVVAEKVLKEASLERAFHQGTEIEGFHVLLAATRVDDDCRRLMNSFDLGYHALQQHLLEQKVIATLRPHWEPVNELEYLLAQAIDEPAYRPAFTRNLRAAEIIFFTAFDKPPENHQYQILRFEGDVVPIFTSIHRAVEQQPLSADKKLVAINFVTFCKSFPEPFPTLILNPFSLYKKEFNPNEVKFWATGVTPVSSKEKDKTEDKNVYEFRIQVGTAYAKLKASLALYAQTRPQVLQINFGVSTNVTLGIAHRVLIGLRLNAGEDNVIPDIIEDVESIAWDLLGDELEFMIGNLDHQSGLMNSFREAQFIIYAPGQPTAQPVPDQPTPPQPEKWWKRLWK
ncbi:SseB family protein [Chryseolinea soli]|nr:SseB family protein [Chryseolinea soli]